MSRALFLCATLVAACQLHLAAVGAVSEDVPVPGGRVGVAATLGIYPVPDRARFISEAARILYGHPDRRALDADALGQRLKLATASAAGADEQVPVPLTVALWGSAVFHRRVAPTELVVAILSDRQAAFLCHGLAGLDDETLQYLADHSGILTEIYARAAPAFAVFSGSVRVHDGRIATPGGEEAIALWEAIVGEPVTRPDRFLAALFTQAEGRTAYLYDTIGQIDRPKQRFALGLGVGDQATRLAGMHALAATWIAGSGEWRVKLQPFARQPFDSAAMLMRVGTDADGRPTSPASQAFWSHVFESSDLPEDPARTLRTSTPDRPVDAAWLASLVASGDARARGERLDQFAFGQRVFSRASPAEMPDVLVALRAFRRYRMLMVTLDRMGIRTPALYAAAARIASRMAPPDPARSFIATAQFQGALALLLRMRLVGTLDPAKTEALVASLVAVPLNQYSQYLGGIVRWLDEDLRRAIGPADTLEEAVLAALSGPAATGAAPAIEWEGQRYRVDLATAERGRLARVRDRQSGPTLDLAVELAAAARTLAATPLTLARARAVATRLQSMADQAAVQARRTPEAEGFPSGVTPPPSARDAIVKGIDELGKLANASDVARAPRAAIEIVDAADAVASQTLVSWAYAVDIGDPEGAALLPGDVSRRHDFGFGLRDNEQRLRAAWAWPRQDVSPGVPWHVDGSLLGLDVGLATVAMRRLNVDRSLDAPTLTSNERETFAVGYALMNPLALTDVARDAIAEAITRGRRRVLALADGAALDVLAADIDMDGWRRRAAQWTLAHEREGLVSMFSLGELVALGDTAREIDLDPWGTSAMISTGCVCTEMPRPGRLPMLRGRPQIGLLATAVPDLNLRVASVLTELHIPARLAKYVLSAAVQDFIDEVRATDPDDWLTMARAAAAMTRERIEDYVAAATADGPLVPDSVR